MHYLRFKLPDVRTFTTPWTFDDTDLPARLPRRPLDMPLGVTFVPFHLRDGSYRGSCLAGLRVPGLPPALPYTLSPQLRTVSNLPAFTTGRLPL